MSHGKPSVGAIGFEIFVETALDIATATMIKLEYRKPDGTTGDFTAAAAVKSGPRDQTIYGAKYVTANASDLDQAGEWEVQVSVVMPGFSGAGQIAKLEVIEAL